MNRDRRGGACHRTQPLAQQEDPLGAFPRALAAEDRRGDVGALEQEWPSARDDAWPDRHPPADRADAALGRRAESLKSVRAVLPCLVTPLFDEGLLDDELAGLDRAAFGHAGGQEDCAQVGQHRPTW